MPQQQLNRGMLQNRSHDLLVVLQNLITASQILNSITGPLRRVDAIGGLRCMQAHETVLRCPVTTNLVLGISNADTARRSRHTLMQELKPALPSTDYGVLDTQYPHAL